MVLTRRGEDVNWVAGSLVTAVIDSVLLLICAAGQSNLEELFNYRLVPSIQSILIGRLIAVVIDDQPAVWSVFLKGSRRATRCGS